jgi:hypothetical protein
MRQCAIIGYYLGICVRIMSLRVMVVEWWLLIIGQQRKEGTIEGVGGPPTRYWVRRWNAFDPWNWSKEGVAN